MKLIILPLIILTSLSVKSQKISIKNSSFEKEFYAWDYGVYGSKTTPQASFTSVEREDDGKLALKVNVKNNVAENEKEPFKIYLTHDKIELKKGKRYRVIFYVKSKVKRDAIHIAAGVGSIIDGYKFTNLEIPFLGNGEWQKLTYTFLADSKKTINFKNAAVYFGFNLRKGSYQIDNVQIVKI